jgi:hypothetical protein
VPAAGGLFFPQSKSLGIDQTETSPALQQKIAYAGITSRSFAQASDSLEHLADLVVDPKQVERLTERIGQERVAERDSSTATFQALPLVKKFAAPPAVTPPDLAVVMVDGGRLQIFDRAAATAVAADNPGAQQLPTNDEPVDRAATATAADNPGAQQLPTNDEPVDRAATATAADNPGAVAAPATAAEPEPDWEEEAPPKKGHWREDKVGLLLSMKSEASAVDPCPNIPPSFLDIARIPKLARQLKKNARAGADAVADSDEPEEATEALTVDAVYQPPAVQTRQVVASRQRWPLFAPLLAAAAWSLGLQGAARKAFVGDGSANNWTLHRRFFGSFVPILDFIHALSYVFAAALAGRKFAEGWQVYQQWIGWLWQGQVGMVIEALRVRQLELGLPTAADNESSPSQVVAKTLTYLENHQDKMKYAEYRKAGLPITSSLMESAVKQINQRVKGSEKFWSEEGSESVLQLRADQLSDGALLEEFWDRRQAEATGQNRYRRAA